MPLFILYLLFTPRTISMKTAGIFTFITGIVFILLLGGCTLTKRRYMPGYYFDFPSLTHHNLANASCNIAKKANCSIAKTTNAYDFKNHSIIRKLLHATKYTPKSINVTLHQECKHHSTKLAVLHPLFFSTVQGTNINPPNNSPENKSGYATYGTYGLVFAIISVIMGALLLLIIYTLFLYSGVGPMALITFVTTIIAAILSLIFDILSFIKKENPTSAIIGLTIVLLVLIGLLLGLGVWY